MKGTELKKLRKKLGLSLSKTAAQLGISARSLCRWESSDDEVPETAARLFKVVNKVK